MTAFSSAAPHLRIRLVENENVICTTTAKIQQDRGHAVMQDFDGARAFAALEEGNVDAMIVNLCLPGISGPALVEAARAKCPTIGVTFTTGQNAPSDIASAVC